MATARKARPSSPAEDQEEFLDFTDSSLDDATLARSIARGTAGRSSEPALAEEQFDAF